jgi:AcrR family transcriptional regulator
MALSEPASTGEGKVQRTRRRLVEAVRAEITARGGFSAESVARRAGTSTATFYNHFATKDEALTAAYEMLMGELVETVADACGIERLLDDGLAGLADRWVLRSAVFFRDNASLFRLAQAAIDRSKPLRDLFRHHEHLVIDTYRRLIERGQTAQVIRGGDVQAMAEALAVVSESWNHPLVQRLEAGSPLHRELTNTVVRMLAPDAAATEPRG